MRPETGLFEKSIANDVRRLAQGVEVAYDIGTQLGYYALALVKQRVRRVIAFDPDPRALASLENTVALNKVADRVSLVCAAVGRDSSGSRSVDSMIEAGEIPPPNFIKMDIDGGEVEAVEGMGTTLKHLHPALVIEVHTKELEEQCISYLEDLGYSVTIREGGRIEKLLLPELRTAPGITHNRWLVAE